MSRVVSLSSGIPVFSATAIQISGTRTPSRSRVTIDCFKGLVAIAVEVTRLKRVRKSEPHYLDCYERILHQLRKELVVRLVLFARGNERFHRFDRVQIDKRAAQFANCLEVFPCEKLFL